MDLFKDIVDIFEKLITSIGIIAAGIWTYLLFITQRLGKPKLDIQLLIQEVLLSENTRLVHAELKLSNIGNVKLTPDWAELRLRQVFPILLKELKRKIDKGFDPVPKEKTEIEWPMFSGREWTWNKRQFEIEPGENDSLHADFVIPSKIEITEFYFYLNNHSKKHIGWTNTTIYRFKILEDLIMLNRDKSESNADRKRKSEQQTRQKQQRPQQPQQQQQPRNQSDKKKS